jgi:hypothetical protein
VLCFRNAVRLGNTAFGSVLGTGVRHVLFLQKRLSEGKTQAMNPRQNISAGRFKPSAVQIPD